MPSITRSERATYLEDMAHGVSTGGANVNLLIEAAKQAAVELRKPLPEEVRRLFHVLWSKAVGTKDYVKAEWIELDRLLHEEQTKRTVKE